MAKNSRAAGLFEVDVQEATDGRATISWEKKDAWRDWAKLSEGCYLLRSNVKDWSSEELWKAYIQLTEAEAAFRIHKSDLRDSSDLASARGSGAGAHPGLLPGLRALENVAPNGSSRRPGRRTSPRARRAEQDQHGRRRPAHAMRRRHPPPLCTPSRPNTKRSYSNGWGFISPDRKKIDPNVVKTFGRPPLKTSISPPQLWNLG